MPSPQRSRHLVTRPQARLFGQNLLYYGLSVAVLAVALAAPLALGPGHQAAGERLSALEALLFSVRANAWPLLVLTTLVFALHSLLLAHRVLGPLMRFRRAFQEIDAGRLAQRITLRPRDYHTEEARAFNAMMDTLSERLHGVKRRYDRALQELAAAEAALASGGQGGRERLQAAKEELDRCDGEWAWFELAPCAVDLADGGLDAPRPARPSAAPAPGPRPPAARRRA